MASQRNTSRCRATSVAAMVVVLCVLTSCGVYARRDANNFERAQEQVQRGECEAAEETLATLSLQWRLANPGGLSLLQGMCAYYGRGELAQGEVLIESVIITDPVLAPQAAAIAVDMYARSCEFDQALRQAYLPSRAEHRQPYLVDEAVGQAAIFYLLQGRPELARRNARLYLDGYPAGWYQSSQSTAPPGVTYDAVQRDQDHRGLRSWMWLVFAAVGEPVAPDLEDAMALRGLLDSRWRPNLPGGAALAGAAPTTYDRILDLLRYSGGIAAARALWLEPDEVAALASAKQITLALLQRPSASCSDAARAAVSRATRPDAAVVERAHMTSFKTVAFSPPGWELTMRPPGVDLASQPPAEPGAARSGLVERQLVLDRPLAFVAGSGALRDDSARVLDQVASLLHEHPEVQRVRIEVHTATRGGSGYDLDLSQRRAESVLAYLSAAGIDPARLEARGLGEAFPLRFVGGYQAGAVNDRVELFVVSMAGDQPAP